MKISKFNAYTKLQEIKTGRATSKSFSCFICEPDWTNNIHFVLKEKKMKEYKKIEAVKYSN
jgi:hypothetical protein